jgi:hypothetical protein
LSYHEERVGIAEVHPSFKTINDDQKLDQNGFVKQLSMDTSRHWKVPRRTPQL